MDIVEAIKSRHSVRQYLDRDLEEDIVQKLKDEIDKCNREGDLNIQLVTGDPETFDCFFAHYGKFTNVKNYIALIGPKSDKLDEKLGYFGERLVILAQSLGLNSCWLGLSYSKRKTKVKIKENEKLRLIIAIGYGENQGYQHKNKPDEKLLNASLETAPAWFKKGYELALLAPTAMNQQKFVIGYDGKDVSIKAKKGFYSKVDLGIVKYHFEVGAGKENYSVKF